MNRLEGSLMTGRRTHFLYTLALGFYSSVPFEVPKLKSGKSALEAESESLDSYMADSDLRRDSLDKSGLFPEWKKMSAPKSQAEKVISLSLSHPPSLPPLPLSLLFHSSERI